jgi:hypothetical protein
MVNDRNLTISVANNRKSLNWRPQSLWWSEFVDKLRTPARSQETLAEFLALAKGEQNERKDVGGFIGGDLTGRRKAGNVKMRDLITLDLDQVPAGGTNEALRRLSGLGCAYAVYSTRKHEPRAPRLRVVIPADRSLTTEEYQPAARALAQIIGMEMADPTTFETQRLMYWPSCCKDSQYVFFFEDKPFMAADGVLALYKDWRDAREWPEAPGEKRLRELSARRQADPLSKSGVVGAFCRSYDVVSVMEELIPGVYTSTDVPGRYTYVKGSTAGGAVVYEEGRFLFSHHATDPASGQLVNAFDLVRLHKFGHLDDEARADTPANRLPSYTAMSEFAFTLDGPAGLLNEERYKRAAEDLAAAEENANWLRGLKISSSGAPVKTIKNVLIALENDPKLRGRISWDCFSEFIMGAAPLPWAGRTGASGLFRWTDADYAGLRGYLEQIFDTRSKELVADALLLCAANNGYNPVTSYLESVCWDGAPRLDTLYVDYVGAEDCAYIRAVARKALVAAVSRAFQPGMKFDTMTVVCGPQGIGKSTLFARLGGDWFSDSLKTFEGKEAAELLQGVWVVEIGELEAYSRTDVNAVKSFLSKCDDQYRAAYAQVTGKHPRRCVFFGTTNNYGYLKDPTGNRRFWPVDAHVQKPTKSVFQDMTQNTVAQIWAEAVAYWRRGESLILPPDLEEEADRRRNQHFDRDPLQGQIEEFLAALLPEDWQKWDLGRRQMFWGGGLKYDGKTVPRDRVCALEIWKECLSGRHTPQKHEARRINDILEGLSGWERGSTIRFGAGYGIQKGFKRTIFTAENDSKICKPTANFVNHKQNLSCYQVNLEK